MLLFPRARNFTKPTQLLNGDLVFTREAAHPAVISMGTWDAKCFPYGVGAVEELCFSL